MRDERYTVEDHTGARYMCDSHGEAMQRVYELDDNEVPSERVALVTRWEWLESTRIDPGEWVERESETYNDEQDDGSYDREPELNPER